MTQLFLFYSIFTFSIIAASLFFVASMSIYFSMPSETTSNRHFLIFLELVSGGQSFGGNDNYEI